MREMSSEEITRLYGALRSELNSLPVQAIRRIQWPLLVSTYPKSPLKQKLVQAWATGPRLCQQSTDSLARCSVLHRRLLSEF
mgnify:CR=1 FL=1